MVSVADKDDNNKDDSGHHENMCVNIVLVY